MWSTKTINGNPRLRTRYDRATASLKRNQHSGARGGGTRWPFTSVSTTRATSDGLPADSPWATQECSVPIGRPGVGASHAQAVRRLQRHAALTPTKLIRSTQAVQSGSDWRGRQRARSSRRSSLVDSIPFWIPLASGAASGRSVRAGDLRHLHSIADTPRLRFAASDSHMKQHMATTLTERMSEASPICLDKPGPRDEPLQPGSLPGEVHQKKRIST